MNSVEYGNQAYAVSEIPASRDLSGNMLNISAEVAYVHGTESYSGIMLMADPLAGRSWTTFLA